MKVKSESEVTQLYRILCDPMDCSLQAPLSMGFSRQEYWSGVPLLSLEQLGPHEIEEKVQSSSIPSAPTKAHPSLLLASATEW